MSECHGRPTLCQCSGEVRGICLSAQDMSKFRRSSLLIPALLQYGLTVQGVKPSFQALPALKSVLQEFNDISWRGHSSLTADVSVRDSSWAMGTEEKISQVVLELPQVLAVIRRGDLWFCSPQMRTNVGSGRFTGQRGRLTSIETLQA